MAAWRWHGAGRVVYSLFHTIMRHEMVVERREYIDMGVRGTHGTRTVKVDKHTERVEVCLDWRDTVEVQDRRGRRKRRRCWLENGSRRRRVTVRSRTGRVSHCPGSTRSYWPSSDVPVGVVMGLTEVRMGVRSPRSGSGDLV